MSIYIRQLVPLRPGEAVEVLSPLTLEPPKGFRWETDAELRERIKKRQSSAR